MRYNYGKLENCDSATIDVGWIPMNIYRYVLAAAAFLLMIVLLRVAYPYAKKYIGQQAGKFKYSMPDQISPFTVSTLVHRIDADDEIRLNDEQRRELRRDAAAIDESYFQQSNGRGKDLDLKSIAARWISTGQVMAGKN